MTALLNVIGSWAFWAAVVVIALIVVVWAAAHE